MDTRISPKSETYWGRRAVGCLFQKFNCPAATMQTCQDMIYKKEDGVLTSVAGLVAGVKGSTCGVVSGGALGIALLHKDEIQANDTGREVGMLSLASDFVNWFDKTYGTTHCSKRSQVDFWTLRGLMKYLFPGHRMIPCMKHINGSIKYFYRHQNVGLPEIEFIEDYGTENIHCSQAVLQGIRAETGVGDPVIERISLVLDGGVALGGGVCGALAGAVLALNLLLGDNLRDVSMPGSYYRLFKGLTYLRSDKDEESPNPFNAVKKITNDFEGKAGSINCSTITDRKFVNWDGFQSFIQTSEKCRDLIDFSIRKASQAIHHYSS
jgi:hypothetical protein